MKVGRYEVGVHNFGDFRLDGGAMFGAVPRALWSREAPPDEANRILLSTRSLVAEAEGRKLLVDLGCGDKWSEKSRAIFCLGADPYEPLPGVTDVLLTHLHFDHCGGVSRWVSGPGSEVALCYPQARHYVSRANLANARQPNSRERASYLPENVEAVVRADPVLLEPGQEVWPGVQVHASDGHTRGLMWLTVSDGGTTVAYPTDLFPTSKHLPTVYAMGYDMCAERCMQEKGEFLARAVEERWTVVFEHDPVVEAGRIECEASGRPFLAETFVLSAESTA